MSLFKMLQERGERGREYLNLMPSAGGWGLDRPSYIDTQS